MPRKAVDDIAARVNGLVSASFIPFIQYQMECEFRPIVTSEIFSKVQFILEKNKNLFDKFLTEHSRFKIHEEESLYIASETFPIGDENIFVANDNVYIEVDSKTIYAAHVPLRRTLKNVSSLPGVFDEIQKYVTFLSENTNKLSNLIQANLWQEEYNCEKIVFRSWPVCLQNLPRKCIISVHRLFFGQSI